MKKVVVKIMGGVGNQMFQYAASYACAKKNGADLLLDTTEFNEYKLRDYELYKFKINENFADENTIKKLKRNTLFSHTKFREKELDFDFSKIKNDCYLDGYFQSEKYFKPYRQDIKEMFKFKNLDFLADKETLNEIKNTNSISISLRFGDYRHNPMYDILDVPYYENCINFFKEKFSDCNFFVFSDDIVLAKEKLKNFNLNFVNSSSWEYDMYLIQNCKHNIIANSSFAWWGAYLNKNENKIVCAPSVWYGTDDVDFKDIVPDNWVKVRIN